MLQIFLIKIQLLIYQIGISPQFCSDISTAQPSSSRLFVTASLPAADRQDVSCLHRGFRTEFFNVKEQLYASYKKKKHTWELIEAEGNCLEQQLLLDPLCKFIISVLAFWDFFPSTYQILPKEFFTKQTLHWHLLKALNFTAVLYWNNSTPPSPHLFNLFLPGAVGRLLSTPVFFCYNHLCSAIATKHLQLQLTVDSGFTSYPSPSILMDATVRNFKTLFQNAEGQNDWTTVQWYHSS